MARRYEFFAETTGNTWVCFDMKVSHPDTSCGFRITKYPFREASRRNDTVREGWAEREGICGYDPCFPGSVRPYSPVRRKDIPQDVLSRLEFPKESK